MFTVIDSSFNDSHQPFIVHINGCQGAKADITRYNKNFGKENTYITECAGIEDLIGATDAFDIAAYDWDEEEDREQFLDEAVWQFEGRARICACAKAEYRKQVITLS